MKTAARILRWLGAALGLLIVVVLVAFGLLQTQTGQAWLARTLERTISTPDFTVAVAGLHGTVPFNLKVDRIDIGDRDGLNGFNGLNPLKPKREVCGLAPRKPLFIGLREVITSVMLGS